MRIYLPSFAAIYKDIHNKKSILAILPQKNKKFNPQNLTPVRDIDDEVVVYRADNYNKYVQSAGYGDTLDKMSYEEDILRARDSVKDEFFRENELFDRKRDSRYLSAREQYSTDDVFVKNVPANYSGENINKAYSGLDTDVLDKAAKYRLDYLHFIEEILPSTFGQRIKLDAAAVEEYASAAMTAMHADKVPLSVIIRTMQRSVLADPDEIGMTNVNLFKFLLKYPNLRKFAVTKLPSGREITDVGFLKYNMSLRQRFDDETVNRIIKECTTTDNEEHLPMMDETLCSLVCRMKPLPTKYSPDGTLNDISNVDFKWTEEDSELIAKIKQLGTRKKKRIYSDVAKELLQKGKDTKYILENIDAIAEYKHILSNINEKLEYYNKWASKQVSGILDEEYEKLLEKDKITEKDTPLISYAKTVVGKHKIRINETMSAYKSLVSYFNGDMEKVTEAAKLCQDAGGKDQTIRIALTKMLFTILDKTGKWDENLVKTMQKAGSLQLKSGDINVLTSYIEQSPENSYQILCNSHEILNRKDKINEILDNIANQFGWRFPRGTFSEKLEEELRLSAANKDFKADNSKLLKVLRPLTDAGHFDNSGAVSDIIEHVIRKTGRLDEDIVDFTTEVVRAGFSKKEIAEITDDILDCKNNEAVTKQMAHIRDIIAAKKNAAAKPKVTKVVSTDVDETPKTVSIEDAGQIMLGDGAKVTFNPNGTIFVDLTKRHKKK